MAGLLPPLVLTAWVLLTAWLLLAPWLLSSA